MRKWWVQRKLEKQRTAALSDIIGERLQVELMAQRPRSTTDPIDATLLQTVVQRLQGIETAAANTTKIDDLDDFPDDAEQQGEFRAYLCPIQEIKDEGDRVIDMIEGWGVPSKAVQKLRDTLGKKLSDPNPAVSRAALHALFEEEDLWADYADDYQETMEGLTKRLFWAAIVLPVVALGLFYSASRWFPPLLFVGLICAGAAGSCVSVMTKTKTPSLDNSLRGELDTYTRTVLIRIGAGVIGSLIGCASLAWVPVAIDKHMFADALNACCIATSCTPMTTIALLGLPALLGFSERTLATVEQHLFGPQSTNVRKR